MSTAENYGGYILECSFIKYWKISVYYYLRQLSVYNCGKCNQVSVWTCITMAKQWWKQRTVFWWQVSAWVMSRNLIKYPQCILSLYWCWYDTYSFYSPFPRIFDERAPCRHNGTLPYTSGNTNDAMTNVKLASNGLLINNLSKPEKSYEWRFTNGFIQCSNTQWQS